MTNNRTSVGVNNFDNIKNINGMILPPTDIKIKMPNIKAGIKVDVKVMKLNVKNLVSSQPYQRTVDQKKIGVIVSNFDIHKFGVPKVSYRNGQYYVFDGQHRVIAYKILFGEGMIECEVHFGLSYEDEARLFAQQYDGATRVDIIYRWNALYEARVEPTYSIVNAVRSIGIDISFTKAKAPGRIIALDKLDMMWKRLGQEETLRVLGLMLQAWPDSPNTFDQKVMIGMKEFFYTYKQEIDDKTFVRQMRKLNPIKIETEGDTDRISGALKYAKTIWTFYNHGMRNKGRLDYNFKG